MGNLVKILIKFLNNIFSNNRSYYFKKTINILKSLITVSIFLWIFILINETLMLKSIEIMIGFLYNI